LDTGQPYEDVDVNSTGKDKEVGDESGVVDVLHSSSEGTQVFGAGVGFLV